MTDKEIIQALRCCEKEVCADGGLCPLFSDADCIVHLGEAATDLIERLTAENAKAEAERDTLREKVPQWVSVKDRLPDCAVPVLVTYIGYDGNRHGDDVATRIDDLWLWWDGDLRSSDERVTVKITHWMPLPEAPEEGEKA